MARSQYQYQPVTGPVFVGIVAATLAWLPSGNWQPTRARPPVQIQQGTVQPFTQALYKHERLEWIPKGVHQPTESLQPIQSQQGTVEPFIEATRYRFERLEWIPKGNEFVRGRAPIQSQQGTVQPFTAALYRMERLEWIPEGQQPARSLPPNELGPFVLDVVPRGTPFDPSLLGWAPSAPFYPRALGPNHLGDTVEPFVDAIAVARNLHWLGQSVRWVQLAPNRLGESVEPFVDAIAVAGNLHWLGQTIWPIRLEVREPDWSIIAPFQPPARFDPATFPWVVGGVFRPVERRDPGGTVQPFTAALYRPEGLQWIPGGRQPWRGLPPNLLGSVVGDPLPHPTTVSPLALLLTDESGARFVFADLSTSRYEVLDASGHRYSLDDGSKGP